MKINTKFKFNLIASIVFIILLTESIIANVANKTFAATIPEKYNLRSEIAIVVKNQYQNGICPYMSRSTVLETHVKLGQKKGKYGFFKETPVFSVLTENGGGNYVPISIDRTEKVLREVYNTNEKTEDSILKVENEYDNVKMKNALKKLKPSLDVTLNGSRNATNTVSYKKMDSIYKETKNNVVTYKNSQKKSININDVNKIRSQYKEFIMEKGGLMCNIQTKGIYDGTNGDKVCLNKTKITDAGNHAVVIIGWDDKYSKNNFPASCRPSSDGAYIVQNSWGANWGNRGMFYVSYEDLYIEEELQGIDGVTEYKDNSVPVIDLKKEASGKFKVTVTDVYSSGVDENSIKYKWTDHNIMPEASESNWTSMKNGQEINNQNGKYLWVYAKDLAGNYDIVGSNNESSGLQIKGAYADNPKWSNKDVQVTITDMFYSMLGKGEAFKTLIISSSFSQEELAKMEKVQDIGNHILTISKEGKHVLYISKYDSKVEKRSQKIVVWIDKTKPSNPEITINGNKENDKYLVGTKVTIKDGEDKLSGVKETNIEIKDKNGKNIEVKDKKNFTLSDVGTYTIKATTTDNAGNSSSTEQTIEIIKSSGNTNKDNTDTANKDNTNNADKNDTNTTNKDNTNNADKNDTNTVNKDNTNNENKNDTNTVNKDNTDNANKNDTNTTNKDNTNNENKNDTDTTNKDNTDNANKNNTDTTNKDNTDSANKNNTETTNKDNTDSANKNNTDTTNKDNTDSANKNNTDTTNKDNTDSANKNNTDTANKDNTDNSNKNNTDIADKDNTDNANKNDISTANKDNTNDDNNTLNSEKNQKDISNVANKKLPKTGTDNGRTIFFAIAVIIFVELTIYNYKKMKE